MLFEFDKAPQQGADRARQVKEWALATVTDADDAAVLVTELRCTEPGCPPLETVIAVLGTRSRREVRIYAPLAEVTREAVVAALATGDDARGA